MKSILPFLRASFIQVLVCFLLAYAPAVSYAQSFNLPKLPPRPDHVIVVIEENHSFDQIFGPKAPPSYFKELADHSASFLNSYGLWHPSQPNYIELFSGSNHGIFDDACPEKEHLLSGPNLFNELSQKGLGFIGYAEDGPDGKYTRERTGSRYVCRHCPWVIFDDSCIKASRSFAYFPRNNFGSLPTVSFVIPNLDHDMHDGSVEQASEWLEENLGSYVEWAQTHNSLLIVTWDEDNHNQYSEANQTMVGKQNHIPTIMVGPMVRPGYASPTLIDHRSILRMLEIMYDLPYMGVTPAASLIDDIWQPVSPSP